MKNGTTEEDENQRLKYLLKMWAGVLTVASQGGEIKITWLSLNWYCWCSLFVGFGWQLTVIHVKHAAFPPLVETVMLLLDINVLLTSCFRDTEPQDQTHVSLMLIQKDVSYLFHESQTLSLQLHVRSDLIWRLWSVNDELMLAETNVCLGLRR